MPRTTNLSTRILGPLGENVIEQTLLLRNLHTRSDNLPNKLEEIIFVVVIIISNSSGGIVLLV